MPQIKLTKSAIDALPMRASDVIYWDKGCPGFGVKVTPQGRKVFLVLYRTAGAASKLRKFTIGPYGKVTLHQARIAAQRVFAAKLEGRDPAGEKREARMREVTDRVADLLETYFAQRLAGNRSGAEISRLLQREIGSGPAPGLRVSLAGEGGQRGLEGERCLSPGCRHERQAVARRMHYRG